MAKNSTIIRFPRCKFIAESRQIAMLHLMEDVTYITGQPVMVSYYTDSSHKDLDTIIAMGVKNGKGKDCFKVITTGQFMIVWDVVESMPDVSSLAHGEVYVYHNLDLDKWYIVEIGGPNSDTKGLRPIPDEPCFYINLQDNTIWTSRGDHVVRPLYDVCTRGEYETLSEILNYILKEGGSLAAPIPLEFIDALTDDLKTEPETEIENG